MTATSALAETPTSTSFVLSQATTNSGGETATSTSFVLDGSVAQNATVGEASSTSFVIQSGFWTSLSTLGVLRIEATGSGQGTADGTGISCVIDGGAVAGDCSEQLTYATVVDIVADANAGSQFDAWTGCDSTSTTTVDDDTCQITVRESVSVSAAFTLLGTIGDRVWRDVDGDGNQDAEEPGLNGVTVELTDGGSFSTSTVTIGDGNFDFADVPPGTYTATVDTGTLPAGTVPSFDADGIGTPNTAVITITDGEDKNDLDFGYQPQVDLAITKDDAIDPLPGGQNQIYTITVENLGPADSTDVVVTDVLPVGTTLVETVGCAEDPSGAPTCSLGDLAIGGMTSFTLEVSIDPEPPASITNTASVAATEVDIEGSNDSDSESTALDNVPPTVVLVDTFPTTADAELTDCETVNGFVIEELDVEFDEEMLDGSDIGDVTDPASWLLVAAGANAQIDTTSCATLGGDDETVEISAITYDAVSQIATLEFTDELPDALITLFACSDALTDLGGTPLDGDDNGVSGGDYSRFFRADADNLLANGHLDCSIEDWTATSDDPSEIVYSTDDFDNSSDSGSFAIANTAGSTVLQVSQCAAVDRVSSLSLSTQLQLSTPDTGITVIVGCEIYATNDCTGAVTTTSSTSVFQGDTAGAWVALTDSVGMPDGSQSALCSVAFTTGLTGETFDARIDQVRLGNDLIFTDGFESGDTSAWSSTVP
ncbi:MAG: SdrD B-like domain-containing protein [Acidobacteriota bacterium]